MTYFDWTATSPISRTALDAYIDVATKYIGNPSSTHPLGQQAALRLLQERQLTAAFLGTSANNIYFTSGGTESNSIILSSLLQSPLPGEIITTGIEHASILEFRKRLQSFGWTFTALKCPSGYLDPEDLKKALNPKVRMVAFMKVNNVTGTILDTKNLVKVVREYSNATGRPIHIHCDAVQALGKIPFFPEQEDIDSASFSAHKICGPRGVGILYNRSKSLTALSRGGGQESGLRPGTENLAGIASMNAAMEETLQDIVQITPKSTTITPKNPQEITSKLLVNLHKILHFRCKIENVAMESGYGLLSPNSNSGKEFSPYIINISSSPIPSEVFLRVMADKGFCLSAGSACSSNSRGKAESVLAAMNIDPKDRLSSIRISMGTGTTEEQVDQLCVALKTATDELGIRHEKID